MMWIRQYSDTPFEIFIVDDLFSDVELHMFENIVVEGITDATTHPFTAASDFKNGKDIRPDVSSIMYERLSPHLPSTYIDAGGDVYKFEGACKYIMFAASTTGQHFGIHTDTGCEYSETYSETYSDSQSPLIHTSKFTVLIYLNEGFEGGETVFYDATFCETCRIQPKKGRMLVFDINLFHAGSEVRKGEKRWIGTELVCLQNVQ